MISDTSAQLAPRVRLLMPLHDAEALAEVLDRGRAHAPTERLLDQLWLRSVLIEQWRRTCLSERAEFERRSDRLLAALDPR
jgi:hypothetical protein